MELRKSALEALVSTTIRARPWAFGTQAQAVARGIPPGRQASLRKDKTMNLDFYRGKRVLLTGHTGFKGSWMSVMLVNAGASVAGFSTCSKKETRLFDLCGVRDQITHIRGDVRDLAALEAVFRDFEPEIVIHMAAQPLVRESYADPVTTYATNVMGTVNVLECVRKHPCVRSFLNVTTDKVYENREWIWGYRENEPLDGYDPYSNSKSCSELVTRTYQRSFFQGSETVISTARAGNVIGGGDFAKDRIIPDCVRAALAGEEIIVRNAGSTRPYQHVLEAVSAYLMIAAGQAENPALAGSYNVGPEESDCLRTGELVDLFVRQWGDGLRWTDRSDGGPHEASFLRLDCSLLKSTFGWHPRWNLEQAVAAVIEWTRCHASGGDVRACMDAQIRRYLAD